MIIMFNQNGIENLNNRVILKKKIICTHGMYVNYANKVYLRNEFHFSGVHGAMNRSGSLQTAERRRRLQRPIRLIHVF